MSIFGKLKAMWTARKVAKRFEEDRVKNGFVKAAKALLFAVAPIVVFKFREACPELVTSQGAFAIVAGVLGAALLQRKKASAGASVAAAGTVGMLGIAWNEFQAAVTKMCGDAFMTQWPTILTGALVVGLGMYMSSHKKDEPVG